nr:MAG TPA: hypothetical protein [Caudoviricetes sp.]
MTLRNLMLMRSKRQCKYIYKGEKAWKISEKNQLYPVPMPIYLLLLLENLRTNGLPFSCVSSQYVDISFMKVNH